MSSVLLLVVLAGWIGVGFWWFVSHQGAPSDAIGSFRRQLGTLERRSPSSVAPANRLGASRARGRAAMGSAAYGRPAAPGSMPSALHRAQVQRRRRDILGGLALTTVLTLVLGLVPALRLLWVASLVSGALLAAYCYLLVQLRTLAEERDLQVRFRHARAPQASDGPVYALAERQGRRPAARPQAGYGYVDAYEADDLAYAYARNAG